MAISGKYGQINIPKVKADEPVFILRTQDKLAQDAIQMYKNLQPHTTQSLRASSMKRSNASVNGAALKRCQIERSTADLR